MNRKVLVVLSALLILALTACGANPQPLPPASEPQSEPDSVSEPISEPESVVSSEAADEPFVPEPAPADLPADPFSFAFSVDGKVLTLPCTMAELEALGFAMDEDKAVQEIETNYQTSVTVWRQGTDESYPNSFTMSIYNLSGRTLTLRECEVESVRLAARNLQGQSVYIAGGITFGATVEEVQAVLGTEPDYLHEDGNYIYMNYYKNGRSSVSVDLTFKDGQLYEMGIDPEV